MPFSVRKVLICPKLYNVFTHFLQDDSLNNLKHNEYVFVTIQNNCKMACHLNSKLIQRHQLHFLNLYFTKAKQIKLQIILDSLLPGKENKLIVQFCLHNLFLMHPTSLL